MNSGTYVKRSSTIDPFFGPEKDRLTVRGLLLIVVIVAAAFAFGSHLHRTAIPETVTSCWRSADGGFVEVGIGDEVFTHLLVSLLPMEEVVLTRRSNLAFGERTRTTLTVNGEDIRLSRYPLIVVVDRNGKVHSGPCPLNRKEIQQLINELPAPSRLHRQRAEPLQETQQFLRNYNERDWPAEIRKLLIAQ